MPKADKKQRHKAKREAKRREMRRTNSISPLKRLADAPGVVECWISTGFELAGQIQVFAYKQAAGLAGISCFLVDRGVVGLKDAWSRMNVDRGEFEGMLDSAKNSGISMRRGSLDEARRIVAGGIRWAQQNGMRLPKDWVRTATLIGGIGDWTSADVSKFKMEFAGHIEDLRQRLLTEPFETYTLRSDIAFTFSDNAPYMNQRTGRYAQLGLDDEDEDEDDDDSDISLPQLSDKERETLLDQFEAVASILESKSSEWLTAQGETPSPDLFPAWQLVMLARTVGMKSNPEATAEEIATFTAATLEVIGAVDNRPEAAQRRRAVAQAVRHLKADPLIADRITEDVLNRTNNGMDAIRAAFLPGPVG